MNPVLWPHFSAFVINPSKSHAFYRRSHSCGDEFVSLPLSKISFWIHGNQMLSGCGFFQRFLKDTFSAKGSEMFFPHVVLPTEACAFCFHLLRITQPSPKSFAFHVMQTTGGQLHFKVWQHCPFYLLKQWQSSYWKPRLSSMRVGIVPGIKWALDYYFEGWMNGWMDGYFENFFFQQAIF